jgi:murein DD-endopeptidase MepM/ murein hydrolase activator NlpD
VSLAKSPKPETPAAADKRNWLGWLLWGLAALMAAVMVFLLVQRFTGPVEAAYTDPDETIEEALPNVEAPLFAPAPEMAGISRPVTPRTIISERGRESVVEYTVEAGDSIFGIAESFDIQPESLLWANAATLNDDPHMIEIGLTLKVPPTDGIVYEWKDGDTVENVAAKFYADPVEILAWPGNHLDMTNPVITPGTVVMVPGGEREFTKWVVPTVPTGAAGVSSTLLGAGGCEFSNYSAYGSGAFIWPTDNHFLSGNDYWSGHLAIDIATYTGDAVRAADSGMVVYAGWIGGGYGNMVMVDHGNGYQTLYAHLSYVNVGCGQPVYQGNLLGGAGSTGNSTGPHLHFEVRYMGGFINPWYVLP